MQSRPGWDDTFFETLEVWRKRATCPRFQTAALIVDADYRIVSIGYNGAPSGLPHCFDVGCAMVDGHCLRSAHAEANTIMSAVASGKSTKGCTLYVIGTPCARCALSIIQAGITTVISRGSYSNNGLNDLTREFFSGARVRWLEQWVGETA